MATHFRVHPAIGIARVGASQEYLIAPETLTGANYGDVAGGLPIHPKSQQPASGDDIRDDEGLLKRQAARFRLYAYDELEREQYPNGGGKEITLGVNIDGKVVKDIIWTVHVANKKANSYACDTARGRVAYENGKWPHVRNATLGGNLNDPVRLKWLVIDPGPRALAGTSQDNVAIDRASTAAYCDESGKIQDLAKYPKSFPGDVMPNLYQPTGPIDTLGDMVTDADGRLLVVGGYGRAVSLKNMYGDFFAFNADTNNDGWFDDCADGPVNATVIFEDDSVAQSHGAWVIGVDPSYAPQIRNVVSAWDDVYDTFVRELSLDTDIYGDDYKADFQPSFADEIYPVFRAAEQVRWVANIPQIAESAHDAVGQIDADDMPDETIMSGLTFIRNPNNPDELELGVPLMPLSLGDSGHSFLSVTKTQYFMLSQWNAGKHKPGSAALGDGEQLDKASLVSCLGGRYVPGIEFSYLIRDKDIYEQGWRDTGCGPFRIKHASVDYQKVTRAAMLTSGWFPVHSGNAPGLEPGDLTKFLALPWHTDYNSCSVHQTAFNHTFSDQSFTSDRNALFWSWPAQRPVAVYTDAHFVDGKLIHRMYSVRGPGTDFASNETMSSFQDPLDALTKWDKIGTVLQTTRGGKPLNVFLETQGKLANPVAITWPFAGKLPL